MRRAAALLGLLALVGAAQSLGEGLLAPAQPLFEQAGLSGVVQGGEGTVPEDPPLGSASCGGAAPVTLACERSIEAQPDQLYTVYMAPGTGFTGTLTATLRDAALHAQTVTCTYVAFIDAATTPPSCHGGGEALYAGTLLLSGAVTDLTSGSPSAGYWEVSVTVG